ncbi:MAG: hypothetical protein ACI4J3_08375 [Oscillospiraceae bacterium]
MIETTYIYSTDNSGLLAWLQANAVPTYFDSVVADETTPSTIHCFVGEQEFLTITGDVTSKYNTFTAANAQGVSKTCSYNYTGWGAYYGYKCAGGLAIACGNVSGSAQYIPVFITKDSSDNTTVILSTTYVSTKTSAYVVSCADRQGTIPEVKCSNQYTANTTTIVPFMCCNEVGEARYTPNAFYMPTAVQYTVGGKLMIDGVAYLSNGAWLLKDQ